MTVWLLRQACLSVRRRIAAALVPCARNPAHISAAQAAPRCVLLGRHTTRYPSLVGLAMHPPGRRTYAPDSWRRALVFVQGRRTE
jgi:hypothetical protein